MTLPIRILRRRTKGWKTPPNTVIVDRTSIFGNPFRIAAARAAGYIGTDAQIAEMCVSEFRKWLGPYWESIWAGSESQKMRQRILDNLTRLRGKNLACWCKIISPSGYMPCHADVLLSLANNIPMGEVILENTRRAKGETL